MVGMPRNGVTLELLLVFSQRGQRLRHYVLSHLEDFIPSHYRGAEGVVEDSLLGL